MHIAPLKPALPLQQLQELAQELRHRLLLVALAGMTWPVRLAGPGLQFELLHLAQVPDQQGETLGVLPVLPPDHLQLGVEAVQVLHRAHLLGQQRSVGEGGEMARLRATLRLPHGPQQWERRGHQPQELVTTQQRPTPSQQLP